MKRVLVPLTAGAEEMETVIVVDVLRRAGVEVVLAGVDGAGPVTCARQVRLLPDLTLADAQKQPRFDAIVLPGGMPGAQTLADSPVMQKLLRAQEQSGGWIGAICAAPIALVAASVGAGRAMTSHPGMRDRVAAHARYLEDRVVRDGPFITSRGPGTAMEFALTLVEALCDRATADKVAAPMLVQR